MPLRKSIAPGVLLGVAALSLTAAAITPYVRRANSLHPKSGKPFLLPGKEGESTLLHNGWKITPAGRPLPSGDLLLGGAFSPDGKWLAIANCGWSPHALHIIDLASEKETAKISLDHAGVGIVWAADSKKIYVSGGASNSGKDIYPVSVSDSGEWEKEKAFKLTAADPKKVSVQGLALSTDGKTLYALNTSDGKLSALDAATGETKGQVEVGDHPLACRLSSKEGLLYVANWGGKEVVAVDVARLSIVAKMPTGEHPNDIALSNDGRLFVSCGNENSVNVYDLASRKPLETIKTSLTPKAPFGSTPNALTITPDGKTLLIANADNNSLCVADISAHGKSRVTGFIPTGWYPSAVLVTPDGKRIVTGSGKGTGTQPNPAKKPINPDFVTGFEYIGHQLNGTIAFVDMPEKEKLADYTRTVYANTPYNDTQTVRAVSARKTVIPARVGQGSPIKHILYIIKENRTYDQVFGDIPKGNGDPGLTLFGRDITPNHHALAEQFVLLDNLYCNGEVSQDGHPWSTSAYCTDFDQRNWPLGYSGKTQTAASDSVTDPRSGFLWEAALKKGLTIRGYGEYSSHKSFQSYHCEEFIGKKGPGNAAPGRDMEKADIFIREFKEFEKAGKVPNLMVMSLGEDHTNGTRPGAHTPKAMVASNDQALGKIVEAISKSSLWKQFAIFVIEDDAQNGPDHVDSHRTIGLVISPYTRRNYLDSTMYSTASMLRTMEMLLGLPPMTQYDAAATPMFESFTDKPDLSGFTLMPPQTDILAKNKASDFGAKASARMDWSDYDRMDEQQLNRILWHSIKGVNTPYPTPVRRALASSKGHIHAVSLTRDSDD